MDVQCVLYDYACTFEDIKKGNKIYKVRTYDVSGIILTTGFYTSSYSATTVGLVLRTDINWFIFHSAPYKTKMSKQAFLLRILRICPSKKAHFLH